VEPFDLDPMQVIQAQAKRIMALTNENVQLTAAVGQLQKQLAEAFEPSEKQPLDYLKDVTDEVVGAEITS
jgi:hypothetical protein